MSQRVHQSYGSITHGTCTEIIFAIRQGAAPTSRSMASSVSSFDIAHDVGTSAIRLSLNLSSFVEQCICSTTSISWDALECELTVRLMYALRTNSTSTTSTLWYKVQVARVLCSLLMWFRRCSRRVNARRPLLQHPSSGQGNFPGSWVSMWRCSSYLRSNTCLDVQPT